MKRLSTIFVALLTVLALGCEERQDALVVLAASSTTDVIESVTARTEETEEVSYGGSSALRLQVEMGAAADVFISADRRQVDALAGRASGEAVELAENRVVIAVPSDSPLDDWRDLSRAERIVMGAPEVPIGRYADRFLNEAGDESWRSKVRQNIASRERNTRLSRSKLELSEADAAILYASDLHDRTLRQIDVPPPWDQGEGVWGVALSEEPRAATFLEQLRKAEEWRTYRFEVAD